MSTATATATNECCQSPEVPPMYRRPTASKSWIEHEAASIERSAIESLPAWTLLGLTARYAEAMGKVAALRRAVEVENIAFRRTLLRELGYAA